MVTLSSSLRQSLIYATLQKRIDSSKEENADKSDKSRQNNNKIRINIREPIKSLQERDKKSRIHMHFFLLET
jgi:hypothetical protein